MERTTKKVITPVEKHEVVLKDYITGGEKRSLISIFLNDTELTGNEAGGGSIKGLKGKLIEEAENLALKIVIVSIDGSIENIVSRALDFRAEDYTFLVNEVNKITSDAEYSKKK